MSYRGCVAALVISLIAGICLAVTSFYSLITTITDAAGASQATQTVGTSVAFLKTVRVQTIEAGQTATATYGADQIRSTRATAAAHRSPYDLTQTALAAPFLNTPSPVPNATPLPPFQLSPELGRIVFQRGDQITVMNADGSGAIEVGSGSAPAWIWMNGAAHIIYQSAACEGCLDAIPSDGSGEPFRVINAWPGFFAVSSDSRSLAFTPEDGILTIFPFQGKTGSAFRRNLPDLTALAWSSDGSEIAFYMAPYGISRLILESNTYKDVLAITAGDVRGLTWSPQGDKLAFATNRDGDYDIFVVDVNGQNLIRLTTNDGFKDFEPTWSPDGHYIAFASNRTGSFDLYVTTPDGSETFQITQGAGSDRAPKWEPARLQELAAGIEPFTPNPLPASSEIAFTREGDIYAIATDGTQERLLTPYRTLLGLDPNFGKFSWDPDGERLYASSDHPSDIPNIYAVRAGWVGQNKDIQSKASDPAMSPDGQRLAFTSLEITGQMTIYTMLSDGSAVTQITPDDMLASQPAWSPDSTELVFVSEGDLYISHSDLSLTRLTKTELAESSPAWSPDGTKIVFVVTRGELQSDLYTINVDGTGLMQLTFGAGDKIEPSWSPDGRYILFSKFLGDNYDIYRMNANGSGLKQLTNTPEDEHHPVWRP